MKKGILYLFMTIVVISGCKKEQPVTPVSQSTCDGSTWQYEITANPAFVSGSMHIQYFDGYMNSVVDTLISGTWTKTVTAHVNSNGQYSANLYIQPNATFSDYYPSGFSNTLYLRIYKDGVEQSITNSYQFCYSDTGTCGINTASSFNKTAYCN